MGDKTNFAQSLMHMIKGNLGTGILAMPISFKHAGLLSGAIGLPCICLIATFCVHLLVRSSQHLGNKMKWTNLDYAALAKASFKAGPPWMRRLSSVMCRAVDATLIVSQLGICCVYLVFIVDNVYLILHPDRMQPDSSSTTLSHEEHHSLPTTSVPLPPTPRHPGTMEIISKPILFLCLVPFMVLISYIRTLKRLSFASACANVLQATGIVIIIVHLIRNIPDDPLSNVKKVETNLETVALGFGSAMFAFEGISVVLPIYLRMKRPEQMGGVCGLINLSYTILLCLYSSIGLLGYLCFGDKVKDSITFNLPSSILSDIVRAMFAISIFLTYPLQFYVPNEIIWSWVKSRILGAPSSSSLTVTSPEFLDVKAAQLRPNSPSISETKRNEQNYIKLEYLFRTLLVLLTFALAIMIPKLNLLMDLVGSISGTALSITLPAIIHLATFWDDVSGRAKTTIIIVDGFLILISLVFSAAGTYASMLSILNPRHH